MIEFNYKKYRWFYTSEKTLVIGGKNAEQNDFLIKSLQKESRDYLVMHTTKPRSPFTVLLKNIGEVKKIELEECGVFTACFSSAWKDCVREAFVDMFKLSQLSKNDGFKPGMWSVGGKVDKIKVMLKLTLVVQEDVIRAVPLKSVKKNLKIIKPGKIPKEEAAEMLSSELGFSKEDLLSALPTGGLEIV